MCSCAQQAASFQGLLCSGPCRHSTTPSHLEKDRKADSDQRHGLPYTPVHLHSSEAANSSLPHPRCPPLISRDHLQKNMHQAPPCSVPPEWQNHSSFLSVKAAGCMLLSFLCGATLQASHCSTGGDSWGPASTSSKAVPLLRGTYPADPCLPWLPEGEWAAMQLWHASDLTAGHPDLSSMLLGFPFIGARRERLRLE